MNYLSCYVPYFFLTTTHDQSIYNQTFHNVMWKNFMPHMFSYTRIKEISINKGSNSLLTGYPFVEILCDKKSTNSVWKKQDQKKIKLIFAPHHTIEEGNLKLSNFLLLAQPLKDLVIKYEDTIQWSFKPHPILKSKLYKNKDWGKTLTDDYYNFWKTQSNTQLDEGDYIDLFILSDAILHDSGSFIAEYLFVEKPCAYLNVIGKEQLESIWTTSS